MTSDELNRDEEIAKKIRDALPPDCFAIIVRGVPEGEAPGVSTEIEEDDDYIGHVSVSWATTIDPDYMNDPNADQKKIALLSNIAFASNGAMFLLNQDMEHLITVGQMLQSDEEDLEKEYQQLSLEDLEPKGNA